MRIIGGTAGGRSILLTGKIPFRPTSERIREALFAVLYSVSGTIFLDLFAGSGSVGLEALSRGAAKAVFVEKDIRLVRIMQKNLASCGFEGRYEIMALDVKKGMRLLAEQQRQFGVVFADPPYGKGLATETLRRLRERDVVSPDGIIILQHSIRETLEGSYDKEFVLMDQRRYGDTFLSFLKLGLQDAG